MNLLKSSDVLVQHICMSLCKWSGELLSFSHRSILSSVRHYEFVNLACETDLTERRRLNLNADDNFHDDYATGHGSFAGNTMVINVTK